jgi:Mg-chelatase subunit ChlD
VALEPEQIEARVNPEATISVIMAIDVSGSMKGKPIQEAMRAANALIDQLSPQDRGAIIAFADEVNLDPSVLEEGKEIGFTADKNALRNVVNFLDSKLGWDTPLYDAIFKSVRLLSSEPMGKRAVIVMTDGQDERDNAQGVAIKDTGSLSTPDDPINEANRHSIPIFSIGLMGLGGKIDTKYLQRLAERTGGVYQEAPEPEQLTPLFENAIDQLKQQYMLTYESKLAQDDQEHSIVVRVQLPQGQAFNMTKFRFDPASLPPPEASAEPEPGVTSVADVAPLPPVQEATAEPPPAEEEEEGFIDKIRDTIEDKPLLAVAIGAGVLLLLVLIVALVVVLVQGRRHKEDEFGAADFEDMYPPMASQYQEPDIPRAPEISTAAEERTQAAPTDWPGFGPVAPPVSPPRPGISEGPDIPMAGGTRVIERAPKHLAMLIDKSRPEHKYDLKGMTNVGRAQDNQLVLDHTTVSRHHAWVKAEGEEFLIFDIGSANGTFVNDERVEQPRRLQDGDLVRFGDAEFVFKKLF